MKEALWSLWITCVFGGYSTRIPAVTWSLTAIDVWIANPQVPWLQQRTARHCFVALTPHSNIMNMQWPWLKDYPAFDERQESKEAEERCSRVWGTGVNPWGPVAEHPCWKRDELQLAKSAQFVRLALMIKLNWFQWSPSQLWLIFW